MVDKPIVDFKEGIASASLERFCAFLRQRYPNDVNFVHFDTISEFVCGTTQSLPSDMYINANDTSFVSLMNRTVAGQLADAKALPRRIIQIGPELDFLEDTCTPDRLSALQVCSMAMQYRRVPREKVAVVLMARDEGIYLPEWLAHYRLIGAEHIFVYTNDNTDGSDALLHQLAAEGSITVIENSFAQGINPQKKGYQHAIMLLEELRDYRWALFVDADEFLTFRTEVEGGLVALIDQVEREFQGNLPGAVVFPWNWRFTDRAFAREDISVLRHYSHASIQRLVKPLINLKATFAMCQVHIPTLDEDSFFVDGDMRPIIGKAVWEGVQQPYSGPAIDHFWSKSFVEFLIKKRRGEHLALAEQQFLRDYFQFFAWTSPWTDANYDPISEAWIMKIEETTKEILSNPFVAEAYRATVSRYRDYVAEASADEAIQKTYNDLLQSTQMAM